MPSLDDLVPLTDASAFIFTGSIARTGASTMSKFPVDAATVVVSVENVIKIPLGLRGFAGREVTVQLLQPLASGRYVFFADPLSVGDGIAVKECAHFDVNADKEVAAAVERGYAARIERRVEAAFLVALGTVGPVRDLLSPAERNDRAPWALAPFEIERALKARNKPRHVMLVGPGHASEHLPRAPALRGGLRAILILQHPPSEAIELLPEEEHQKLAFIADTLDIQPYDQLETILQIIRNAENRSDTHA